MRTEEAAAVGMDFGCHHRVAQVTPAEAPPKEKTPWGCIEKMTAREPMRAWISSSVDSRTSE